MNLAVRIRSRRVGSRASDSLRAHIQRRLQVSLAPFDQRLSHVSVRVTDTESVAGEPLYACHVEVEIRPSGGFLAEEAADPDVSTAVDLAADRIGLALRRTLASTAGGLAALETG